MGTWASMGCSFVGIIRGLKYRVEPPSGGRTHGACRLNVETISLMTLPQIIRGPLHTLPLFLCLFPPSEARLLEIAPSRFIVLLMRGGGGCRPSLNTLLFICECVCVFYASRGSEEAEEEKTMFNHANFLLLRLTAALSSLSSRSSRRTCERVRCTSPTGARGPAGTRYPTSSAPTGALASAASAEAEG